MPTTDTAPKKKWSLRQRAIFLLKALWMQFAVSLWISAPLLMHGPPDAPTPIVMAFWGFVVIPWMNAAMYTVYAIKDLRRAMKD